MSEAAELVLYWKNESLTAETEAERQHAADVAMGYARFLLDSRHFSEGSEEGTLI